MQGHWLQETNINNLWGQILVHLSRFSTFFFFLIISVYFDILYFFSYTPNCILGLMFFLISLTFGLLFLFLCILLSFECFSHIIYMSYNISTCYWLFDSLFCCVGFLMFCLLLGFKARNGSKACENIECGSFKHNLVIVCQDISLSKNTNNLTL